MEKIKYPKTLHVEWSEGVQSDDKIQHDLSSFEGQIVVITEKMDGENTTFSKEYFHARSLDSNNHLSRNYVKGLWGKIKHEIPEGWRICGENLFAKHSIHYTGLPDYFMVFSIWDKSKCLSWKETCEWCSLLGLITVPVLYNDLFQLDMIQHRLISTLNLEKQEGFVIRLSDSFLFEDFSKFVVKWVRKSHVQTDKHWLSQPVIKNILSGKNV